MSNPRSWPVFWLCLLAAGAGAPVQAGESPSLARIFLAADASDADALRIRDNIVSFGAVVRGYARGDVFVVAAAPQALTSIASVHKVAKVDLLPQPPAVRADSATPAPSLQALLDRFPRHGVATPTPQQAQWMQGRMLTAGTISPTPLARRRSLLGASAGLPTRVDNSLSPHFPPIGEQEGRASCVAWAAGYYWSTYEQAADEGLDVSGTWLPRDPPCDILTGGVFDPAKFALCLPTIKDPPRPSRATEHIASPAFLYPLIRVRGWDGLGNPTDDGGAYLDAAMWRLGIWGVGSWQMKPYDPWKYDAVVYEWPTEAQWIEALRRRTQASFRLPIVSDAAFAALKQHLANGHLAVAGFTHHDNYARWGWDRSCQDRPADHPGACPGIAADVVYSDGGTAALGKHAVAIVGYDDERSYYDAEAGQVKQGALLMANSASPGWGVPNTAGGASQGYFWMAYDYARQKFGAVYYNSDRPSYRPRMYTSVALTTVDRDDATLAAGVGVARDGNVFAPPPRYEIGDAYPRISSWGGRPFEAGKRMVVDLSDGLPQIDPAASVPRLYVAFTATTPGTIGPADFYLDRTGGGSFTRLASPDPVKAVTTALTDAVMCTDAPPTADIDGSGVVDRLDVTYVSSAIVRGWPLCRADPMDFDRDRRITVLDARKVALRCTFAGCARP